MTVTSSNAEDEASRLPAAADGTTVSLVGSTATTDRCAECGAALAPDQRYCIECGTRRGQPRFALQPPASASAQAASGPAPTALSAGRVGGSPSGATLLAMIAALLLAIGIGVVIGDLAFNTTSVRVVVNGAGGGAATSGSGSSSTASGGHSTGTSTSTGGSGSSKTSSGSSSSNSSVKPGGKCTAGTSGCVNGKETGNFFPTGGG